MPCHENGRAMLSKGKGKRGRGGKRANEGLIGVCVILKHSDSEARVEGDVAVGTWSLGVYPVILRLNISGPHIWCSLSISVADEANLDLRWPENAGKMQALLLSSILPCLSAIYTRNRDGFLSPKICHKMRREVLRAGHIYEISRYRIASFNQANTHNTCLPNATFPTHVQRTQTMPPR